MTRLQTDKLLSFLYAKRIFKLTKAQLNTMKGACRNIFLQVSLHKFADLKNSYINESEMIYLMLPFAFTYEASTISRVSSVCLRFKHNEL